MVHLVSVHDEFHARVVAARLGSDGILTELRPPSGGPYRLRGEVRVYVGEDDLHLARQLLLADQAEASPDEPGDEAGDEAGEGAVPGSPLLAPLARVAVAAFLLLALLVVALSRAG